MFIHQDMDQLEMEQKDAGKPSIDSSVQLQIWIVDHTFHILYIHFNCKVSNSKDENADCLKHSEESI